MQITQPKSPSRLAFCGDEFGEFVGDFLIDFGLGCDMTIASLRDAHEPASLLYADS
jgi:hypothetical protein